MGYQTVAIAAFRFPSRSINDKAFRFEGIEYLINAAHDTVQTVKAVKEIRQLGFKVELSSLYLGAPRRRKSPTGASPVREIDGSSR